MKYYIFLIIYLLYCSAVHGESDEYGEDPEMMPPENSNAEGSHMGAVTLPSTYTTSPRFKSTSAVTTEPSTYPTSPRFKSTSAATTEPSTYTTSPRFKSTSSVTTEPSTYTTSPRFKSTSAVTTEPSTYPTSPRFKSTSAITTEPSTYPTSPRFKSTSAVTTEPSTYLTSPIFESTITTTLEKGPNILIFNGPVFICSTDKKELNVSFETYTKCQKQAQNTRDSSVRSENDIHQMKTDEKSEYDKYKIGLIVITIFMLVAFLLVVLYFAWQKYITWRKSGTYYVKPNTNSTV